MLQFDLIMSPDLTQKKKKNKMLLRVSFFNILKINSNILICDQLTHFVLQ